MYKIRRVRFIIKPHYDKLMVELEKGWMKKQIDKAIEYYDKLPQERKDVLED